MIDEWKTAYRFLSVQANAIGTAISVTYASMYDRLKADFPPKYIVAITAVVFVLGIIGRMTSQKKDDVCEKKDTP